MVAASPVRFECEYHSTLSLPGNPPVGSVDIVIGKVVGIHIDESVLTDGKIDVKKTVPIARLGYYEYAVIRDTFEMIIPGGETMRAGLEGSAKFNREAFQRSQDAASTAALVAVNGEAEKKEERKDEQSITVNANAENDQTVL